LSYRGSSIDYPAMPCSTVTMTASFFTP